MKHQNMISAVKASSTVDNPPKNSNPQNSRMFSNSNEKRDIACAISQEEAKTSEDTRCSSTLICLLVGFFLLLGSISMTVCGFLATQIATHFSVFLNETVTDVVLEDTLQRFKTWGPVLIGCAVFIMICASVLLLEKGESKNISKYDSNEEISNKTNRYYIELLRKMYLDEISKKENENKGKIEDIEEYFEYLSKFYTGRRPPVGLSKAQSLSVPNTGLNVLLDGETIDDHNNAIPSTPQRGDSSVLQIQSSANSLKDSKTALTSSNHGNYSSEVHMSTTNVEGTVKPDTPSPLPSRLPPIQSHTNENEDRATQRSNHVTQKYFPAVPDESPENNGYQLDERQENKRSETKLKSKRRKRVRGKNKTNPVDSIGLDFHNKPDIKRTEGVCLQ